MTILERKFCEIDFFIHIRHKRWRQFSNKKYRLRSSRIQFQHFNLTKKICQFCFHRKKKILKKKGIIFCEILLCMKLCRKIEFIFPLLLFIAKQITIYIIYILYTKKTIKIIVRLNKGHINTLKEIKIC